MTNYTMNPINNGTRLRSEPNTLSTTLGAYNKTSNVVGTEIWTAPADGAEVRKGDRWLKVSKVDDVEVSGWMAIVHKGTAVCTNLKEIEDEVDPPVSQFPDSFVLTDPKTGSKAEYVLVKVL
jgi:hypothetical protein